MDNESPELLFTLRKVDAGDLVARTSADLPLARQAPASARVLEDSALAEVFGIEMAQAAALLERVAASAKRAPTEPPEAKRTPAQRPVAKRKQAKTAARGKKPAGRKHEVRKPAEKRVPSRRRALNQ